MSAAAVFEELGGLFRYPDEDYVNRLGLCRQRVVAAGRSETAADELERIESLLSGKETWEIEEFYTRAFDLNPVCALEIGWHLYGEQYERGRFLVRSRDLLASLDIDEAGELPDHLSSMLVALGRLGGDEAEAFAARFLVPALRRMGGACKGAENPLLALITIARDLAEGAVGDHSVEEAPAIRPDLVQIGSRRNSTPAWRSTP